MNLLTLKALMHTLKKLARDFLMQEIARTRSSSCKNLHHTMQVFRASLSLKWRGKISCSRNMQEQDFLPLQSQEYRGEMCEDRGSVWKPENSRAQITPLKGVIRAPSCKCKRASVFSKNSKNREINSSRSAARCKFWLPLSDPSQFDKMPLRCSVDAELCFYYANS